MTDTVVLIPAAGSSNRMGFNKLFAELCGSPVLAHTIRQLSSVEDVASIILAVSPGDEITIQRDIIDACGLIKVTAVVPGGETRVDSVWNAFQAVRFPCELVAVHDAARPFVSRSVFRAALSSARESGAAIVATPVIPTIKKVDAGLMVSSTPDRRALWAAATPQVFRYSAFKDAYATFRSSGRNPADVTDDAQLLEYAGYPVAIVPGNPENIKLTTPFDWQLAQAFADQWLNLP